jgi:hypothetical protein
LKLPNASAVEEEALKGDENSDKDEEKLPI